MHCNKQKQKKCSVLCICFYNSFSFFVVVSFGSHSFMFVTIYLLPSYLFRNWFSVLCLVMYGNCLWIEESGIFFGGSDYGGCRVFLSFCFNICRSISWCCCVKCWTCLAQRTNKSTDVEKMVFENEKNIYKITLASNDGSTWKTNKRSALKNENKKKKRRAEIQNV